MNNRDLTQFFVGRYGHADPHRFEPPDSALCVICVEMIAELAVALDEARNKALEEAAALCEHVCEGGRYDSNEQARFTAKEIRNLKSEAK
jgi:hypothetical protein